MSDRVYKSVLWWGLVAVLVFTPLARGAVRVWSITPVLLVIYSLAFIWLLRMDKGQRTGIDSLIFVFAALAAISFIFSIYKHDSFYALLRLLAYIALYYLVVNNFDGKMIKRLIGLVIIIGTGLSAYGLLQYFGVLDHSWWYPPKFLAATYVNHNHFSGYLELVIPVTIAIVLEGSRHKTFVKFLFFTALIIMTAAFVFSQSRGAWVSLAISLIVMNLILIKRGAVKKGSIFILLLVITLIFACAYFNKGLVSDRIDRTVTEMTKGEPSLEGRLKIWQGTVDMIRHSPIVGVGIGDYVWGFPRYRPAGLDVRAHYAHNDYLHMTAEMSVFALPIMILILVRIIMTGLFYGSHITHHTSQKEIDYLRIGCATAVLSLALHGFIDFNFHTPANMILYTIYAAIIMRNDAEE